MVNFIPDFSAPDRGDATGTTVPAKASCPESRLFMNEGVLMASPQNHSSAAIDVEATKQLMQKIKETFHLESYMAGRDAYHSIEELSAAFLDNVMLEDTVRKLDMALILYCFLDYMVNHKEKIQKYLDEGKIFIDFSFLVLHLMPSGWLWEWRREDLKQSIEPFLAVYRREEAKVIREVICLLRNTGIFIRFC